MQNSNQFYCIQVLQIITKIRTVFIMLFFQFCIPYPGPVFCLLLGVSSGCARPITGQVTSSQNVENSPHYSPWRIMRRILCIMAGMRRIGNAEMFSALSPCYGWNADIMQRFLCIPVRILPSAFSPHFLHIFSIQECEDFSAFLSEYSHPHFLHIFFCILFHTRMQSFLCDPVRILLSAFSP